MTCPDCGQEVRPGQRYCDSCGRALSSTCASCGASLSPTAKFCPECGTAVGHAPAAAAPEAGEGVRERRLVSVLFVDLAGFTAASAAHGDPERTRDFQERYFALCREVVARYGGTIEKYIGDAVMAVWGVPAAHEDDAERAVRAALDLVAAVARIDAGARAAVATGHVAAAPDAVGQGIVAGDVVNLAARLQGIAEPGAVLVDEPTARAVSAAIAADDAGEHELKGIPGPTRALRVTHVVAGRRGSGRSSEIEPPFVGRDAEIGVLKDLFNATSAERRLRLVSITGQAGIGKSRLAREFYKYVDGLVETVYWHQGRSPAYGEGVTFWALGEMVRQRARLAEDADPAATRAGIRGLLDEWVEDADGRARIEPALAALLGTDDAGPTGQGELFSAWRSLFDHVAERGPVVLLFEDLQWADSGLLDFIAHLAEWSRQRPIFVITLARPELFERAPTWGAGQRNFTSIHLEPLSDAAMETLVSALVPRLPHGALRSIVARAEGVPLYAVEWVRMLVDNGTLAQEGSAYRLTRSLADVPTPQTLHAVIAARIDALPPALRQRLQQASVLGSSFTLAAFDALTGLAEAPARDLLDSLVRRELLRVETDTRSPERGQYQFVQAVIREVAYERLARRDRKGLHLAAARHFESLGDEELVGVLARHYLEAARSAAGEPEEGALTAQARIALRGATERAVSLHAYDQALALTKLALSVASDAPEIAALKHAGARSAQSAARLSEAISLYREAIEEYRQQGDVRAAGDAACDLATLLIGEAQLVEGRGVAEEAQAALHDSRDDELAIRLRAQVARSYFLASDNETALPLIDAVIEDAERIGLMPVLIDAFVTKGPMLIERGDRQGEGLALLLGSIELARLYGLAHTELRARQNAVLHLSVEDPPTAARVAREQVELAARLGLRDEVQFMTVGSAWTHLQLGRVDEVRRYLDQMAGDEETILTARLNERCIRAQLAALEGNAGEAYALLRDAETVGVGLGSPQYEAAAPYVRAWVSYVLGDFATTVDESARAMAIDPLADSFPRQWRGRAFLRLGRLHEARRALADARAHPRRGRLLAAHITTLDGAIAAAEGRLDDAERLLAAACDGFRAISDVLGLVLAQLEVVVHLGLGRSLGRTAAEELRATTDRLGWAGVRGQLERAIERGPLSDAVVSVAGQPGRPSRADAPAAEAVESEI